MGERKVKNRHGTHLIYWYLQASMYKFVLSDAEATVYHAPDADVKFMKGVMFLYKAVCVIAWLRFASERP
jgi:hypothetical protein